MTWLFSQLDVEHIADYGVAIFSIGCLLVVVLQHMKFMRSYTTKLTESQVTLSRAIDEMLRYMAAREK